MHFTEFDYLLWLLRYGKSSFCSKLQQNVVCHTLGLPAVYVRMRVCSIQSRELSRMTVAGPHEAA